MADLRTAIRIAAARGLLARGLIAVFAAASPAHSDPLRIVAAASTATLRGRSAARRSR